MKVTVTVNVDLEIPDQEDHAVVRDHLLELVAGWKLSDTPARLQYWQERKARRS